ncbi:putative cytochrome 86B1-like [Capsicum annuum]|nr:putative cytochrome 86B1-like [Capsicum annuum]
MKSGDPLVGTSSASDPTLSELEEDIVHGIDDDLEIIVKLLTGRLSDLDIVTISGMGGIGKTTLARKAYDHSAIRYHFDILHWVTISQEFRGRNVMLEAIRCISMQRNNVNENDYDKMDKSELANLVQKNLKGPRYLVVVDDIWSRDVWDNIRGIFPNFNNRSRILLTTRETEVAMYANTNGFIRTFGSRKSLEEVAIDYLEDLIGRNLIQARKRKFNGEIKACGMHDLVHEFSLIEAEMIKHMHVKRTFPPLQEQKPNVRRIGFQTQFYYIIDDGYKLFSPSSRSIYLFSFWNLPYSPHVKLLGILPIYRHNPILHEFFSHFNLLRVLAIFNIDSGFESFPLVLTMLFHLRYLQIHFHGNILESISELQNLQTLICDRYPAYITLPEKIWMMKNLRYTCLTAATYLPSPRSKCILNKTPVTGMPNLEEFFGLTYASCTNEIFSLIPNLKRLTIHETSGEENIFPDGLINMSSLRKLEAFKFYGRRLEDHKFAFATSLRRLSLTSCSFYAWEDLSSTIIRLPNLEELKLKLCQFWNNRWSLRANDKVQSLKLLLLSDLYLDVWEASSDNFPKLKRLVLKNCENLQEIPLDFGEIGNLGSIELHDCSTTVEDSARKIEQEQEDMGNNSLKVHIHNSRSNF